MRGRGRDPGAIRAAVRERYAGLVTAGRARCGAPGGACETPQQMMEGKLVKLAGYAGDLLERLPAGAVVGSYGCGDPLAFAEVEEGQTVLDVGSGAGMDCLIASRRVGPGGRVIGIDMTAEMLERARENAREAGCTNVEFRLGVAEAIPVEDETVDWVISNCAINLSPEKPLVFAEIARVLKPGGRFSIADIVVAEALHPGITESVDAWTGCVAGAISETEYVEGLRRAGLRDVEVAARHHYDAGTVRGFVGRCDLQGGADERERLLEDVVGHIWSARLRGMK